MTTILLVGLGEVGARAARQLAVYEETRDLKAVMDFVVRETEHGLGPS